MNSKEFFDKVAAMRRWQKEYFRIRTSSALRQSKALEKEIESETMQMLDRKTEYNQNGGQQQQTQQTATYQPQTPNFPNANKKDDDLPF